MKNLKVIISFLAFGMLVFAVSCDTTEVVDAVDYTYSVTKVSWGDPVDENGDGYATNKPLSIFVSLAEDVTRHINVKLFFRAVGGPEYSYYAGVTDIEFEGIKSPLSVQIMVGPPNRELITGIYDFRIEVYESGSDKVEAAAEKEDAEVESADQLGGQKFESLATDQIYNMKLKWGSPNDKNGNGFVTQASLFVDVNIEKDYTKEVKVELYHKEKDASDYTLYETTPEYQIHFDDSLDAVEFKIGEPPRELNYGIYNFKIVVYETGIFYPVAILDSTSADEMADSLLGRKFETSIDDSYFYTIDTSRIFWTERLDLNADSYTASRKLNFNVDVDKNEQRNIWIQVYYKTADATDYKFFQSYYENSPWLINGGNDTNDIVSLTIGPLEDTTKYLHKNSYDFLVNVLESGQSVVVTSASEGDSDSLKAQHFETAHEDSLIH